MHIRTSILTASACALLSATSFAYGYSNTLSAQEQNNVTFITGGIGDEERNTLQQVRRDYNLHITNAGRNGAFSGENALTIYDRMGNELVATDAGPLFYAELPAGRYVVSVKNDGVQQKRQVKIPASGASDVHFVWP